jgi:hypothetical protein
MDWSDVQAVIWITVALFVPGFFHAVCIAGGFVWVCWTCRGKRV